MTIPNSATPDGERTAPRSQQFVMLKHGDNVGFIMPEGDRFDASPAYVDQHLANGINSAAGPEQVAIEGELEPILHLVAVVQPFAWAAYAAFPAVGAAAAHVRLMNLVGAEARLSVARSRSTNATNGRNERDGLGRNRLLQPGLSRLGRRRS